MYLSGISYSKFISQYPVLKVPLLITQKTYIVASKSDSLYIIPSSKKDCKKIILISANGANFLKKWRNFDGFDYEFI